MGKQVNNNLDAILDERGATYGRFADVASVSQALRSIVLSRWLENDRFESLPTPVQAVLEEGLQMMCSKLARLACGDPMHTDTWADISGYSTITIDHALAELDDFLNDEDVCNECKDAARPEFDPNFDVQPADPAAYKDVLEAFTDVMKTRGLDVEIVAYVISTGKKATK